LRVVAEKLRQLKEQAAESGKQTHEEAIQLAEEGAKTLEAAIAQWDKRDQYVVFVGLGGLILSFGVKIWAVCSEP
jgi:hypothetical protein